MSLSRNIGRFRIVFVLVILSSLLCWADVKPASADPGKMIWTAIDTPSTVSNVIARPSEINFIAIGSDDRTFYAVDIPDPILFTFPPNPSVIGRLYKSGDGGVTWQQELSAQLIAAGAFTPVWNIAVAPDDVNFIVAVTDSTGWPVGGPTQVYISTNGGALWQNSNFPALGGVEWISCVDISVTYGGANRDVAIGTRTGAPGTGRVFVMKAAGFSSWVDQILPPSDVVALKFSPSYPTDTSLIVVSSNAVDTRIHLGLRDTAANTTTWDGGAYPLLLWDAAFAVLGNSPTVTQIITADLELPSDFSGQDITLRRLYVSTDTVTIPVNQSGVYRIDDTMVYRINPPTGGRISSIAYFGTYVEGVLLAGEVTAAPSTPGMVNVWRTSNPTSITPTWYKSDTNKSPTGGGNPSIPGGVLYANAQVAWNNDGTRAYCGTSSACLGPFISPIGAAVCTPPQWPGGYLNGVPFDESAFSVSPYASAYKQLLDTFSKTEDTDIGNIWNQLSLIDTSMDDLTDVAVLEAPQTGENLATVDYDILYLSSRNIAVGILPFNSIWRSTSGQLGTTWERILCRASANVSILRVKQTAYDETGRSDVIIFGNLTTDIVGYSANEGQAWNISSLTIVNDLAVATDTVIYILNNTVIYRYEQIGTNFTFKNKVDSQLDFGHTIAVPLKNPPKTGGTGSTKDMVIVGEAGPPNGLGRISYVDFSEAILKPNPPISARIPPPVAGDAHVIFDDKFEVNGIIYNAIQEPAGGTGKIYRWTTEKSTVWDELVPPNAAFYGLAQRNDVLYGAWRTAVVPVIIANTAGVDRTLFPRRNVPPPPEWDYLVTGLPIFPAILFTREPSSLKVSSNQYNSLWAIDNIAYGFPITNAGRLWEYTDILAKVGPWTTSPASGSLIPVDPRSGRAVEVNFGWRSLGNITAYEMQVAKDIDFYNRVLVNENIIPVSQLAPEVYLPAGALIPASGSNIGNWGNLEAGHTYYWRVRARRAVTGEIVRSPWSATMYFTVESGLRTTSPYLTFTLFSPIYGAKNVSTSPSFSWSGMPGTTEYEFVLAKDINLQQVVVKVNVPTTSYLYNGTLDYNTNYFWQVRSILPVVSDLSPIGTFTVVAESKPVTPETETAAPIPSWIWWIIAIFTALVGTIIAFTMVKPGYVSPRGGKLFKIEPIAEKPKEPMAKPAGGKLDNLKPIVNKLKSGIAKIWNSITMAVKRQRFFRKRTDGESKDSGAGDDQPTGSQDQK
ncbi:MAG: hypothetical protein MUO89_09730 [Dehalococcoidia bacterium]|nr:hypothetical protein [Dehalococcoidia bacterium]